MMSTKNLVPFTAALALMAGGAALIGCQSDTSAKPNSSSGDTMSGTGGGNGTFGSNPSQAMHSNPADTQPAR